MGLPALKLDLSYQAHRIRMVGTAERPEWVAADVCDVLGLSDVSMALKGFEANERGTSIVGTPSGDQEMLTLMEPGLYRLIFKSRKAEAKSFQKWALHDVLPCIRKHGCYPAPSALALAGENRALVTRDRETIELLVGEVVGKVVDEKVIPRLARLEASNARQEASTARIESSVAEVVKYTSESRAHPTEGTKRDGLAVVAEKYGGKCPCCKIEKITDTAGNPLAKEGKSAVWFDHWLSVSDASPQSIWPVCEECNRKLGRPNNAGRVDAHSNSFIAYQEMRKLMFGDTKRPTPKKVKDCPGQMPMFGL